MIGKPLLKVFKKMWICLRLNSSIAAPKVHTSFNKQLQRYLISKFLEMALIRRERWKGGGTCFKVRRVTHMSFHNFATLSLQTIGNNYQAHSLIYSIIVCIFVPGVFKCSMIRMLKKFLMITTFREATLIRLEGFP